MTEVFLRRLTRWQADQQRESIADLYVAAYRGETDQEYHDRRGFLKRFADDVQRPGFDMLVASETTLAGCIYGYPPHREGEWWHGMRGGAPEAVADTELSASGKAVPGKVFVVVELMVIPARRRSGIATRLQERLLTRVDADLVTTLVAPANTAAAAAFRSWGWSPTGGVTPGEGRPALDVWSRRP